MTMQEIFETLSENEEKLFYASCAEKDNETLKEAHKQAKNALISFAKATGLHN